VTFYYAIRTQNAVYLLSNRPSADAIWDALRAVPLPHEAHWVGPLARIVRDNTITTWSTTVTWVLAVDGPYSQEWANGIARDVANRVTRALMRVDDDFVEATAEPYSEGRDGPLPAWQTGSAAQPRDDNTPIKLQEQAVLRAQQTYGAAQDAVHAVGSYIESAGHRLGSSISSTATEVQRTARMLLIGGGAVLGLILVVKVWRSV
jgi:hypothetical protein